jgi:hypothetical protein
VYYVVRAGRVPRYHRTRVVVRAVVDISCYLLVWSISILVVGAEAVVIHAALLQISTWRPSRTKATHSTKPWGWAGWVPCSAVFTLAAVRTASPGPPITETAALRRAPSDPGAVSGLRRRDGSQDEASRRSTGSHSRLCQ